MFCLFRRFFFVYKPAISLPTAGYYPITAKQKQHYHATVTILYVRGNAITRNM